MERFFQQLSGIHANRVLDIATRYGDFAGILAKGLGGYRQIVAIDINEKALEEGRKRLADVQNVVFEKRDACHTGYPAHSFDVVAIANSLHHIPDLDGLFAEMKRLLAPGGTLLIAEMTRDGQDGAAGTHAKLHWFESDVDTACGVYHARTFSRQEILDLLKRHGLRVEQEFLVDDFNPNGAKGLAKRLTPEALSEKLAKAEGKPEYAALSEQVAALSDYYAENGVSFANMEIVIAKA